MRMEEVRTPAGKAYKLLSLPFYMLPRLREIAATLLK